MKQRKHGSALILSLLLPLAAGGLSAALVGGRFKSYAALYQPLLAPPGWVFPVVWTALYLLMGLADYLVRSSDASPERKTRARRVYLLQLFFNAVWPLLFFSAQRYWLSFVWLVLLFLLAALCTLLFRALSEKAGKLLYPYLLWLFFAAYLNLGVCLLN